MALAGPTSAIGVTFELDSVAGRGVLTAGLLAVLAVIAWLLVRAATRGIEDAQQRYNTRRLIRAVAWFAGVVGLVIIWRPLSGDLAPALGIATAGVAFAMQEVIGAIAGWFNITFGGVFRVGDRVQMAGVQGDVIDVSLLKTRLMEIGADDGRSWVRGRQHTGRVVSVSNKATFTEPVYNYSSYFGYIWEEFEIAVPHHGDWQRAAAILEREARRQSDSDGAREAMAQVRRRFPVPATEVEPRVFASADETYVRLAARFVVPIRSARSVKNELVKRTHRELESAGIEVVSTTVVQQAAEPWTPTVADSQTFGDGAADES